MQEILEINSRDLTDGELDYDVVDLEAGELNINTIDLDSGALETVTVDASRIIPLERDVAELKSRGNVRYDTQQNLSAEQQQRARDNIGIAYPEETEPLFNDWVENTYSSEMNDKVDKVSGKGLSTNDYTNEDRSKLASIATGAEINVQADWNETDYNSDAYINNKPVIPAAQIQSDWEQNDNRQRDFIKNKPSIPSQLSDLSSDSTHRLVSDAEKSTWNSKQDAIDDLEDIRENASAGATALQSEEDPIFSASAASGITAEDIASWNEHTSNIGTITGVSVNGTSVATSGVANISSVPASILEGTIPNGITAITQNQGDGSNKIATTSYVDTAINNLPDPMIFRGSLGTGGTITSLPTAASTNVGHTYKVIEDGTYANQSAKTGDTFISDGSAWILIPSGDEPSGTVTSIKIEANSPIQIDNDAAISTSGTRTLSHATSGVTAGTYRVVTVNNTGHVTAGTTEAIYILTTNWNSTATQCYLRSQYFLNSLVPTQKGDLILCRGNGNLFKCGDLVYDSQEEVYYTNPTYLCNVLVAQGTSSQFIKGDGSLDNNAYAGAQTSGGAANKAVSIPFGQVDSTSTSTAFTATVDGITELRDGVCVYLKNGVANSASGCTLNVNGLGAKPMYNTMAATTAVSTQWNVNYTMLFIYNSTRVSGGCWDMYYGYNSDTNTVGYNVVEYYNGSKKVKTACQRYQVLLTTMDGLLLPIYSGAYSIGTTKVLTTEKFNPFGQVYYYNSATALSANDSPASVSILTQATYTVVDLRYSFNTGTTLTAGNDVYLVCVPQDDGSAVLHTSPIAFSLPSTEDGLIYKRLGKVHSISSIILEQDKPCYYYNNGSINLWTGTGTQTDISKSTESNVIDIGEYDLMKINEVKGKSLVMNQRVKNPNPSITNNTEWSAYNNSNVSIEYVEDGVKATIVNEGYGYSRGIAVNCTGITNTHKYLAIITIKPSVTHDFSFETGNGQATNTSCTANQWTKVIGIVTASRDGTQLIVKPTTSNLSVNDTFTVRFASCIDLTQMFGAGKEPTTVEEVEAILGNDYYEYNTGEVVGNNVDKLDVYDSNDVKKGSLALNLSELTGKVNGEGTSVTIFPDGLHGVGTAYDSLIVDEDGYARRAVKRIGSVDLGTLTWVLRTYGTSPNQKIQLRSSVISNINQKRNVPFIFSKYDRVTSNSFFVDYNAADKTIANWATGMIGVQDSAYSDAATFKTAMSGVMLYYELATPIEYVLDTPVQCVTKVYPNGTVKQVPVMPDSTPMVMDVTYLRDTGGFIGRMMNKLASLEARIAALEGG